MSVADALNRALRQIREEAPGEETLAAAYRAEFRRAGRECAANFEALAGGVQAAADWTAPTVAQVTDWRISMQRIRGAQRAMLGAIGGTLEGVPGVDFQLGHPILQDLLDKMGARAEGTIRAGVRGPVAAAIARGWAEGQPIPKTARYIRDAVNGVAPWQATMLARTDTIALSNGASQWTVEQLNAGAQKAGKPKPVSTKTWTSAGDSRVRPSHQEADGQTVPFDQSYRVGGATVKYPGDPSGPSDEVVNCRCVEIFNESTPESPPAVQEPPQQRSDFGDIVRLPLDNPRYHAQPRVKEGLLGAHDIMEEGLTGGFARPSVEKMRAISPDDPSITIGIAPNLNLNEQAWGMYQFLGTSPVSLRIDPAGPHLINTTLHEVGHFIDHIGLAETPGVFGSVAKETPEWLAWEKAIDRSRATAQMKALKTADTLEIEFGKSGRPNKFIDNYGDNAKQVGKYVDYTLDRREQWARSFAQYMTKRHGTQAARDELVEIIADERNPEGYVKTYLHWDDDDFGEISDAVEAVLRSKGLIDDKGLTGAFWRLARLYRDQIAPGLLPVLDAGDPASRRLLGKLELRHDEGEDLFITPTLLPEPTGGEHVAQGTPASRRLLAALPSSQPPRRP